MYGAVRKSYPCELGLTLPSPSGCASTRHETSAMGCTLPGRFHKIHIIQCGASDKHKARQKIIRQVEMRNLTEEGSRFQVFKEISGNIPRLKV